MSSSYGSGRVVAPDVPSDRAGHDQVEATRRRKEMVSNGSQQQVVVVVGSSFAGLTAALELRKHLDRQHRVVVLDRRPDFTFIPSLVWLPFGKRRPEDITFPLAPMYERKGVEFRNATASGFDLDERVVH